MKKIIYPNLLLILVGILFLSCSSTTNFFSTVIIKGYESLTFGYQYVVGGRLGSNTSLKINADTTHYYKRSRVLQSPEIKTYTYETTIKTPDEQWSYLIKKFDLETFKRIRSGRCGTCVDASDEIFSVIIDGVIYSFTNGYDDWNYQEMKDFFDSVKKISAEFSNGNLTDR